MRETLTDLIRQCGGLFDVLKVTGTATETKVDAANADKTAFVKVALKEPIPEFEGTFGISNLGLLNGLLNFSSYKATGSSFNVKRRKINDAEIVEQLEFRDANKTGATFRLMSAELAGGEIELRGAIPWEIEFTPDKSKVAEFTTLANLYSEVEKTFAPKSDGEHLTFYVGLDNSSTHNASMVFQENVGGTIRGDLRYSTSQFLSVLKLAGQNPVTISITSRGVMKITIETDYAVYSYFIRCARG